MLQLGSVSNFENRHWNLLVAQPLDAIAQARHLPLEQVDNCSRRAANCSPRVPARCIGAR
jgi:hypothetical protein